MSVYQRESGFAGQAVMPSRQRKEKMLGAALIGIAIVSAAWFGVWAANDRHDAHDQNELSIASVDPDSARLAKIGPPGAALDLPKVARGKRLYEAACIACHGPEARGVAGMGRDLVNGGFSLERSDKDVAALIVSGRAVGDVGNSTGKPMPPRGGRADYTTEHISDVVAYLRSLQDPRRLNGPLPEVIVAVLDADTDPAPAPVVATATGVAAPANLLDPQAVLRGKKVYSSCITCHGKTGVGVPKTGADLVHSDFLRTKTDEELVAFVKKGRQPGDPDSKMKLAMPAKGGNPAIKDNQIQDVIVYLRSLQQAAADTK